MTLFTEGDQPKIVTIDPNKDYFVELVGEGKPFKTEKDLARGKAESDAFIENLKNENAALRKQGATAITMQEFLDKLEKAPANKGEPVVNNQNPDGNQPNKEENNNTRTISEEDIVRVFETREEVKSKKANLDSVKSVLQKVWGVNYSATLDAKVAEMGVSQNFLDNMAATSPKAFLKLLDVEAAFEKKQDELSVFTQRPASVNTQGQQSSNGSIGPKTLKEFKKAFPKERDFYTPRVQNAMTRTIKEVGEEKFYS